MENSIGALDIRSAREVALTDSEFDGNKLTFDQAESWFTDKAIGETE